LCTTSFQENTIAGLPGPKTAKKMVAMGGGDQGVRIGQVVGGYLAIFTWRSKNEKVGYGYGNKWVTYVHTVNIAAKCEEIVTKSKYRSKKLYRLINCLMDSK
jgi:hypothetical protein